MLVESPSASPRHFLSSFFSVAVIASSLAYTLRLPSIVGEFDSMISSDVLPVSVAVPGPTAAMSTYTCSHCVAK